MVFACLQELKDFFEDIQIMKVLEQFQQFTHQS
jgi:hypothetical protein